MIRLTCTLATAVALVALAGGDVVGASSQTPALLGKPLLVDPAYREQVERHAAEGQRDAVARRTEIGVGRDAVRPVTLEAIADCVPNPGKLLALPMWVGDEFLVYISQAQAVGALALLAVTTERNHGSHGCGVPLPGIGSLHLDLGPASLLAVLPGSAPASAILGSAFHGGKIPDDPFFAGFTVFAQGMWLDPTPGAMEPVRLTNALTLHFGQ